MWMKDKVTFKIVDPIKRINHRTDHNGEVWIKEVNIVSWNEKEPKVDIREWNEDHTQMKKGITLTFEEAEAVADALNYIKAERSK